MALNKIQLYQKAHQYLNSFFDLPLQILDCAKTINNAKDYKSAFYKYNQLLHDILNDSVHNPKRNILNEIWRTTTTIEDYINTFPETTIATQEPERYYKQPGDKLNTRVLKVFKRVRLSLRKTTTAFGNIFRKNKKYFTFHQHCIKEQKLARYIYMYVFIKQASTFVKDLLGCGLIRKLKSATTNTSKPQRGILFVKNKQTTS